MFCVGIFLQHAQQSTNEMVRMVCYTVFAQNRCKNQKVPFDCGHDQVSDIFLILQKQGGVRTYETAKQKSTAPRNPALLT